MPSCCLFPFGIQTISLQIPWLVIEKIPTNGKNLLCNLKKKKIKNGECLIEMCHIIPSSKENTLWQKVSQNLVLGWDRVESAQSLMYIFGMMNPSQKRGLAPVFSP